MDMDYNFSNMTYSNCLFYLTNSPKHKFGNRKFGSFYLKNDLRDLSIIIIFADFLSIH